MAIKHWPILLIILSLELHVFSQNLTQKQQLPEQQTQQYQSEFPSSDPKFQEKINQIRSDIKKVVNLPSWSEFKAIYKFTPKNKEDDAARRRIYLLSLRALIQQYFTDQNCSLIIDSSFANNLRNFTLPKSTFFTPFENFKKMYNKTYADMPTQLKRRDIYALNTHELGSLTFYNDLSDNQFQNQNLPSNIIKKKNGEIHLMRDNLSIKSVDPQKRITAVIGYMNYEKPSETVFVNLFNSQGGRKQQPQPPNPQRPISGNVPSNTLNRARPQNVSLRNQLRNQPNIQRLPYRLPSSNSNSQMRNITNSLRPQLNKLPQLTSPNMRNPQNLRAQYSPLYINNHQKKPIAHSNLMRPSTQLKPRTLIPQNYLRKQSNPGINMYKLDGKNIQSNPLINKKGNTKWLHR